MTKLYIKIHNITGLKYFGKTSKDNVQKYKGSGRYWQRHIKKHGYDVSTIILGKFENDDLLINYALGFSACNDIVNSNEWANLKVENGQDGGAHTYSEQDKQKMSDNHADVSGKNNPNWGKLKENNPNFGSKRTAETKQKMSKSLKGRIFTEEHKNNMSKNHANFKNFTIYNNGTKQIRCLKGNQPKGYILGMITIQCPHCHKCGSSVNMKRWHFENCKFK